MVVVTWLYVCVKLLRTEHTHTHAHKWVQVKLVKSE